MDEGAVRPVGTSDTSPQRQPPRRWLIALIVALAIGIVILGGNSNNQSDRSAATVPSLPTTQDTSTGLSIPTEPVLSALDSLLTPSTGPPRQIR